MEIKPTQAEWLKDKFDLPCVNFYKNGELAFDGHLWKNSARINNHHNAPEQHVVVEWLRVNHGIWVWVQPYKDHAADNNDPIQHQMNVYKNGVRVSKEFNTHAEAYSAAFDYIKDNNLI